MELTVEALIEKHWSPPGSAEKLREGAYDWSVDGRVVPVVGRTRPVSASGRASDRADAKREVLRAIEEAMDRA